MNARLAAPRALWPALPEIALAACLVGLATFTAVVADGDTVAGDIEPAWWWQWALVIGSALPVAFRRVAPLVATSVTIVAQLALWCLGIASAFFAPLVMIYTVCAEAGDRGRRLGAASGLALVAMTAIGVAIAPDVTADLLVFTALATAMAYLLGTQTAAGRAAEVALAEELATAQAERDMAQERAAAKERQRIARELHDIVGHSLAVIAVRAEAADRVAAKQPQEAADAVGAIASIARSSLGDVRRVLAGLREPADADLAPLPSLGSVPGLVNSFADAGLQVHIAGGPPADEAVGATVGAGAYRIVQEALTNVLKHGGPDASAVVRLDMSDALLTVCIEDTGRGITAASNTDPESGSGLGHTGMRERADVLGGHLDVGPRPGGGYRVVATLPINDGVGADA